MVSMKMEFCRLFLKFKGTVHPKISSAFHSLEYFGVPMPIFFRYPESKKNKTS